MISKERLKAQIDKFPEEELSIDELINRLLFIENWKVESPNQEMAEKRSLRKS